MTKPNVFIVTSSERLGGPGKGMCQFLTHAPRESLKYELFNIVRSADGLSEYIRRMQSEGIEAKALIQNSFFDPAFIRQAHNAFSKTGCNVVQSHDYKSHVVGAVLSRSFDVPWVAWAHGWTAESLRVRFIYNRIDRLLLKFSDVVITVSPKLFSQVARLRGGEEGCRLILNAVSRPGDHQVERERNLKCLRIGVVGRLAFEKGQDLAVEALANLVACGMDAELWLVGEGPLEKKIRKLADNLGIHSRLRFVGYVDQMELLYPQLDLLLLPSRSEGLPNVVLEAIAHDLPVVVTDVGGVREIVEEGRNGWIVSKISALEISRTIERAHKTGGLAALSKVRISATLYPKFDPYERVTRILQTYRELLEAQSCEERQGQHKS